MTSERIADDCKSAIHPIDLLVGLRLREIREALGLTQRELGGFLGLSSQQIQKYEHGTNRVSASRLFEVSRILSVHINYFFDENSNESPRKSNSVALFLALHLGLSESLEPEISELISLVTNIPSSVQRKRLLDLMITIESGV